MAEECVILNNPSSTHNFSSSQNIWSMSGVRTNWWIPHQWGDFPWIFSDEVVRTHQVTNWHAFIYQELDRRFCIIL